MKPVKELDRNGKINLLNMVKRGEITPGELTPDKVVISDPKECFMGLMMESSGCDLLITGPAKASLDSFMNEFTHEKK